jgi:hypothetical protein
LLASRRLLLSIVALTIFAALTSAYLSWTRKEPITPDQTDPTLATLRKVDSYPVYEMTYNGDYNFEEYLKKGGDWPRIDPNPACTCFAALSGQPIFGRNFDFPPNPVLVLHTSPLGRYASMSIVDLGYFGFDMQHPPDSGDLSRLLETPYLPFDGMNERGVFVAMMAVTMAESPKDSEKVTIGEIEVIRLVLDYASDLDEALDLMDNYNIEFTEPPIHYIIADKSGASAVVEFLDGEVRVIRNTEPWQVSTNFIITGSGAPNQVPCWRYRVVYDELKEKVGALALGEAMVLLKKASQQNTVWSAVYDPNTLEMSLTVGGNYGNILSFKLQK